MKIFGLNFLKEWILPPKVFRFFLRSATNLYRRPSLKDREILGRNSIFNDKYKGRRCFVIGNGPSLNKVDLSPLKNEITIVMGLFDHHPILEKWQPTIHCSGDGANSYTQTQLQNYPDMFENWKRVSKKIFPEAFFFPLSAKEIFETNNLFPKDKTYYLDMKLDLGLYDEITNTDIDLTKRIPAVYNTSLLAVMLAMAIGCKKIYLLGLDLNWLATSGRTYHFYHEKGLDIELDPHSLPRGDHVDLMEKVVIPIFTCHRKLYRFALKNNIEIINVTDGSYLDEYPQAKFEDIV